MFSVLDTLLRCHPKEREILKLEVPGFDAVVDTITANKHVRILDMDKRSAATAKDLLNRINTAFGEETSFYFETIFDGKGPEQKEIDWFYTCLHLLNFYLRLLNHDVPTTSGIQIEPRIKSIERDMLAGKTINDETVSPHMDQLVAFLRKQKDPAFLEHINFGLFFFVGKNFHLDQRSKVESYRHYILEISPRLAKGLVRKDPVKTKTRSIKAKVRKILPQKDDYEANVRIARECGLLPPEEWVPPDAGRPDEIEDGETKMGLSEPSPEMIELARRLKRSKLLFFQIMSSLAFTIDWGDCLCSYRLAIAVRERGKESKNVFSTFSLSENGTPIWLPDKKPDKGGNKKSERTPFCPFPVILPLVVLLDGLLAAVRRPCQTGRGPARNGWRRQASNSGAISFKSPLKINGESWEVTLGYPLRPDPAPPPLLDEKHEKEMIEETLRHFQRSLQAFDMEAVFLILYLIGHELASPAQSEGFVLFSLSRFFDLRGIKKKKVGKEQSKYCQKTESGYSREIFYSLNRIFEVLSELYLLKKDSAGMKVIPVLEGRIVPNYPSNYQAYEPSRFKIFRLHTEFRALLTPSAKAKTVNIPPSWFMLNMQREKRTIEFLLSTFSKGLKNILEGEDPFSLFFRFPVQEIPATVRRQIEDNEKNANEDTPLPADPYVDLRIRQSDDRESDSGRTSLCQRKHITIDLDLELL